MIDKKLSAYCDYRDIVKKKREEQFKMVWRVSPVHKRLQVRMEHMRRFRHQHEQLRTVIVRVLRPTRISGDLADDGKTADPLSLEAADASAIEVTDNRNLFTSLYFN